MAATTFTLDNGCLSGDKIRVSVPVSAWDYSFYNSSSNSQRRARGQETKSEAEREREGETGNITYTQREQLAAPQSKVETVLSSFKVHASDSNCYTLTLLYRTSVRLNQIIYI